MRQLSFGVKRKWRLLWIFELFLGIVPGPKIFEANPDTKRLYDDLLSNYNRLIRPVPNNTQPLVVGLGLKLSQLIEMVNCTFLLINY